MDESSDIPTIMMEIMETPEPVIYIMKPCMRRFLAGAWAMLMATCRETDGRGSLCHRAHYLKGKLTPTFCLSCFSCVAVSPLTPARPSSRHLTSSRIAWATTFRSCSRELNDLDSLSNQRIEPREHQDGGSNLPMRAGRSQRVKGLSSRLAVSRRGPPRGFRNRKN